VLLVFYAVFFASEALLGVSGILAVVTMGLGMGWYSSNFRLNLVLCSCHQSLCLNGVSNYYDLATAAGKSLLYTPKLLCVFRYGKYAIWPSAVEKLEVVTSTIAALAEALIFFFSGIVSLDALAQIDVLRRPVYLGRLALLFVVLQVVKLQ